MNGPSSLLSALTGDPEIEALFSNEADLKAMLRTEAALSAAQAENGLISQEAARRIAEVCDTFEPDWDGLRHGMATDGAVVPDLVRQLREAVGAPHRDAVHLGTTSQDIIDTGLVLRLRQAIDIIAARQDALITALQTLCKRDGGKSLMAHTRMQVALPITVDAKIKTWVAPLQRSMEMLVAVKSRLLVVQLGGPVGTRDQLGPASEAILQGMAARLDLGFGRQWHSDRSSIGDFGSWLSLLSGSLGKIGQDVALLAQNEVAAIELSNGGGSSAMAHKRNPVTAEVLVALARFNSGLLGTLHQALVHESERSGAAWTLEWLVLPQMVVATGAGLAKARDLVTALRFT